MSQKHKYFIHEFGLSIKTNPYIVWSYVKSKTGSGAIPQDMFLRGEKLSTPESQADTFNKYFSHFFQTMIHPVIYLIAKKTQFSPRINYSD